MRGIDPKWGAYLGLAVIIEQGIGHGTVSLTNLVPADWTPYITSWCNFLAFVGTSVMTYQAAVSSPTAGPAINTSIAPTSAVVKILLIAFALSFLVAFPGDANAKACIDPLNKLPIGCTPRQASPADPSAAKTLLDLLSQPLQDLANFISSDFTQAAALTNSVPNMPDGNGNSCWNLLLSANAIFKTNPANQPLPGAATVLEQLRLLGMVANRVCQNAACTQVFTEAGNAINSIVPIPNLPSLTTLCSKVPAIAQVAITTPTPAPAAPAVTVAPAPAPTTPGATP